MEFWGRNYLFKLEDTKLPFGAKLSPGIFFLQIDLGGKKNDGKERV